MSTRSQLRFRRQTDANDGSTTTRFAQIYRHSDGYPSGVIPDLCELREVCESTGTLRGPHYAAANFIFLQKLRGMGLYVGDRPGDREGIDPEMTLAEFTDNYADAVATPDQPHYLLGYGVEDVGDIHGDEEHLYIVDVPERTGRSEFGDWTVSVSRPGSFGRFDDRDGAVDSAWEQAEWRFTGTLDEAVTEFGQ